MIKKITFSGWIVLLSLTFAHVSCANSFDVTPPFSLGGIDVGNTTHKGPIKENQIFSIRIKLKSWNEPVSNIKMKISLPPEVILKRGNPIWEGNLEPKNKAKINIGLTSKTDWSGWTSPIEAHVEFYYEGEKYTRNMTWSAKGYEDTCWQGKNADYYNRWCIK